MRVDPREPPHAEEQSEQNAENTPERLCAQDSSGEEEPLPESCDDDRFEPL
ncbi:hypothetical protein ACFYXF_41890 [Streptomyces sp. NPDC002680]|uniref:hypothetical protein n=1 Tax=Streptomyces sp. NPDC002680 TaxID=3364659 RepID=UPI0036C135E1